MLIVTAGMIGLGKTTLAELINTHLNGEIFYESVDDNPILPLYYSETDEEILKNRYPFLLQLYFLNNRFDAIKKAALNATKGVSVIDRSIYEDSYFAKINYDAGRMSDLEYSIYHKLLNNMLEEIDGIPKKAPSLLVYLDGSFETVIDRITNRGRSYELDPSLLDYYKLLWTGYKDWLVENYKASEYLIINMDNYDIVNNEEHKKLVLDIINDKLNTLK